ASSGSVSPAPRTSAAPREGVNIATIPVPRPGGMCVDEYVCITVLSMPGEPRPAFAARLSRFWTRMLRDRKSDFERVYAETTAFEEMADRLSRQYLAEADVIEV